MAGLVSDEEWSVLEVCVVQHPLEDEVHFPENQEQAGVAAIGAKFVEGGSGLTTDEALAAESAQVAGHLSGAVVLDVRRTQFMAGLLETLGIGEMEAVVFDEDLTGVVELNETPVRGWALGGFEGLGLFLSDADKDDAITDRMLAAHPSGGLVFALAFLEVDDRAGVWAECSWFEHPKA